MSYCRRLRTACRTIFNANFTIPYTVDLPEDFSLIVSDNKFLLKNKRTNMYYISTLVHEFEDHSKGYVVPQASVYFKNEEGGGDQVYEMRVEPDRIHLYVVEFTKIKDGDMAWITITPTQTEISQKGRLHKTHNLLPFDDENIKIIWKIFSALNAQMDVNATRALRKLLDFSTYLSIQLNGDILFIIDNGVCLYSPEIHRHGNYIFKYDHEGVLTHANGVANKNILMQFDWGSLNDKQDFDYFGIIDSIGILTDKTVVVGLTNEVDEVFRNPPTIHPKMEKYLLDEIRTKLSQK